MPPVLLQAWKELPHRAPGMEVSRQERVRWRRPERHPPGSEQRRGRASLWDEFKRATEHAQRPSQLSKGAICKLIGFKGTFCFSTPERRAERFYDLFSFRYEYHEHTHVWVRWKDRMAPPKSLP